MSGAVNSFMGGLGQIGGDLMSGNFGGALSSLGSDILGAPGWIANNLFGMGGATGQPMAGGPGATPAFMAQGAPNVAGGGSGAPMSAVSFPSLDLGPSGQGNFSALQQALGSGANIDLPANVAPMSFGGDAQPNWMRQLLPAALTAYSVYRGNQGFPGEAAMRSMAGQNSQLSHSLQQSALQEMQGHLPGAAEAGIQQGLEAAKAAIRSRYAGMGLTGSTMEAQDIANAESTAVAQRFAIGQQMAQTGFSAAFNSEDLASQLYYAIMQGEMAQGTQLGDALSAFAGASVPASPVTGGGP